MADEKDNKTTAKQRGHDNIIPHQFKPGQSGNPNGPPKANTQMWRHVCKYMEMTLEQLKRLDRAKLSMSQISALKTVENIAKGKWAQQKEVIERDEGKVPQRTELTGAEGEAIKFYADIDPEEM